MGVRFVDLDGESQSKVALFLARRDPLLFEE
jgi:hypothetical protein